MIKGLRQNLIMSLNSTNQSTSKNKSKLIISKNIFIVFLVFIFIVKPLLALGGSSDVKEGSWVVGSLDREGNEVYPDVERPSRAVPDPSWQKNYRPSHRKENRHSSVTHRPRVGFSYNKNRNRNYQSSYNYDSNRSRVLGNSQLDYRNRGTDSKIRRPDHTKIEPFQFTGNSKTPGATYRNYHQRGRPSHTGTHGNRNPSINSQNRRPNTDNKSSSRGRRPPDSSLDFGYRYTEENKRWRGLLYGKCKSISLSCH